ncbi:NADH-quinone oxidoreductase subunit M [Nocardioides aquaticus]|uniref:NADH-quinone oxidoreductase subunit M n=1 Tax=Nocardioides aquaticus TaxID=160826 RepID=A0ABX8EMF1_9ACTN|nr:NADH-quinone oxidoreductase subunit M [Nocardioides aquaticus]QVT81699.1 NADH-quinone oxidoreductase subunit M [Nocardioides aquaticus]
MNLPLLTLLCAVPLVGAVAVAFLPSRLARPVGLAVSLLTLVVAAVIAIDYSPGGGYQHTESYSWIPSFGVTYSLGVDGLGLLMVLLTAVLVPIVLVAAWRDTDGADQGSPRAFFAWALALEGLSLLVFTATDVFLFYVVFEATLIPAYFLVGGFGRRGRGAAASKFLLFQLGGGLVLLGAVIGLYVVSAQQGTPSYLLSDLVELDLDSTAGRWLFVGFFIAFAIKAPLFPVHTWLADTTEKATPATSVLLVCVLDKIGTFGMLRFCLGIFPEASDWATPVVMVLALISIVYGALLAIGQDDVMRLIGLTSLSHFGFIVLGIFATSTQGISGSVLYMVNHGVATAALFLLAGFLVHRSGTASIREMGGLEKVTPVLAGLFLVAGLATAGLPGLSQFVSEILVLISAFDYAPWAGAVAVSGIVLAAIYVLWLYQRVMTGPTPEHLVATMETTRAARKGGRHDLGARELGAVVPLMVALVAFGFYPQPLLDLANPYAEQLQQQIGITDQDPYVPAAAPEEGE